LQPLRLGGIIAFEVGQLVLHGRELFSKREHLLLILKKLSVLLLKLPFNCLKLILDLAELSLFLFFPFLLVLSQGLPYDLVLQLISQRRRVVGLQ